MAEKISMPIRQTLFVLAVIFCFTPFASPPVSLALGLVIALTLGHPFPKYNSKATKILLQVSVVGLGFGMNLASVLEAGRSGILFTIATIFGTLTLGYFIGRWLGIERKISHLISSGTAICGGSAIAAVGPVIEADEKEMSVALGTVFILNSVALFIFPLIGSLLHLSQTQFGIWAAIAIHDTSSVVGAAAKYGDEALKIATTVKLARALWIIPLALATSFVFKSKSKKINIPYFIFLFVIASVIRTYVPLDVNIYNGLTTIAKTGLVLTLFLIGAGLSRSTLRSVGVKPFIEGILLWIVIGSVSLWAVTGLV
ncbi:MAG TPA: putative sulfate exporter family transporter [Candidatus Kapabacteria bacterium]|nr:putative sulfate exporter family transporter [Candidatus Kapabacteria bacterium]